MRTQEKVHKHIQTVFQTRFKENGEDIRQLLVKIIEVLFPDMEIDWQQERGKIEVSCHPCYTWVEVKFMGVNFALDNHEFTADGRDVFGSGILKNPQTYVNFEQKFKVIVFKSSGYYKEVTDVRKQRAERLLKKFGFPKPTWEEYHNELNVD